MNSRKELAVVLPGPFARSRLIKAADIDNLSRDVKYLEAMVRTVKNELDSVQPGDSLRQLSVYVDMFTNIKKLAELSLSRIEAM